MKYKLSPSALSLMKDCPRCFWLDKNGVWRRPQGIFPSLPSGMDLILKKHFDAFRDRNQLPPELRKDECKGMKLFGEHDKEKDMLDEWRNNRKGIKYEDEKGNILMGAVDNLLVHGNKLVVLDYKTRGFELKEDTHEHYIEQMDVYNFLLRKNGFETEDYSFLLFYFPDKVLETGEILFNTRLLKIKANSENAEALFNKALNILNSRCPEVKKGEDACQWCRLVEF